MSHSGKQSILHSGKQVLPVIAICFACLSGCAGFDDASEAEVRSSEKGLTMEASSSPTVDESELSEPQTDETTSVGAGESEDPFAAQRQACVSHINELRATEGLAPLARWTDGETCSDEASLFDSEEGPHASFSMCDETAQNSFSPIALSVRAVLRSIDRAWEERELFVESGRTREDCILDAGCFRRFGHYLNLSSPLVTKVACGFAVLSNGDLYTNQNFQ